jgi:hypothetical protein
MTAPFEERFWSKVDKSGDCWEWTGSRTNRGRYGQIAAGVDRAGKRQMVVASRAAWELAYGPIPAGLHVLHACDNPGCVRPDHLMLGSLRANTVDADRKGRRSVPAKTHCKHGHELTGANVYIRSDNGKRQCRPCKRIRANEWYRRARRGRPASEVRWNGEVPG